MDAQPEGDFETSDSAPKPKAKSSVRRASAVQSEPAQNADEQEQIESTPEPQEESKAPTPVQMYEITAPIYRNIRIEQLARRNPDVLWLVQEVERLKKALDPK
jgi:hypothetical protein